MNGFSTEDQVDMIGDMMWCSEYQRIESENAMLKDQIIACPPCRGRGWVYNPAGDNLPCAECMNKRNSVRKNEAYQRSMKEAAVAAL